MDVDEGLYSRQLYVLGHDAQRKLTASSALIIGLNGSGVEAAKNIVLAGISTISLYDPTPTTFNDLASNFYLTEEDIGFGRASVCVKKLSELNPYVKINVITTELQHEMLHAFTVVVLFEGTSTMKSNLSMFCHNHNIAIIICDTYGVFGNVFCDFGKDFIVTDTTGELANTSMVAHISNDTQALVTVLEESRHKLNTGDTIHLTEVHGELGKAINGKDYIVNVKDAYSFEINIDTSHMAHYIRGGYITEVKKPISFTFKSYTESIINPGEFVHDMSKGNNISLLHIVFQAITQFEHAYKRLPTPGNVTDAETIYTSTLSLNASSAIAKHFHVDDVESCKSFIMRVAMVARGQISPICSILGGIVGQEVLKACSGKFTPITQWYYLDASDCLSDDPLPESLVTPLGSRYDSQIMVFGTPLQTQLEAANMFLVGAGAIGCEMLKCWALMGISCGATGLVHITDMDHIEKSNLSRQFLFRNADINHPKSATASRAVKAINPAMHIRPYENKVAPETEEIFNDDFYDSIDMICTALDNVEARLYVDQRCLFYQKPMLESGTLGTKGNTQVVVPGVTENYGATRDPPEQSIPVCTLKHFPNNIAHTLQWAREWFEEVYKQTAEDSNSFVSGATTGQFESSLAAQQNMKLDTLTRAYESLVSFKPNNYFDCIVYARIRFEDLFSNRIQQLLHNFPLDRMTSAGTLFWSGAKRPPQSISFSATDDLHIEFVVSVANLRAEMYGIPIEPWNKEKLTLALSKVDVPVFRIADNLKIPANDEEAKAMNEAKTAEQDVDQQCSDLLTALKSISASSRVHLNVMEFDKDIDSHMRVVTACSNLRARNYTIPEADLYTSRGIAGRIIPAIATTTALVTGFICLEIYKILQKKPITAYSNTFTNLAISLFTSMEPEPPKVTVSMIKGVEWKWTSWDKIAVDYVGITLTGLLDFLSTEYALNLTMLSSGVSILYSDFMNKKKLQERMNMPVKEIYESITKKTLPPKTKYLILEVIATDKESEDEVELPYLRLRLY